MAVKLPYGKWTCEDGREVLFNRRYEPIWEKQSLSRKAVKANPGEYIRFKSQDFFYGYGDPPWLSKKTLEDCEAILRAFGACEMRDEL